MIFCWQFRRALSETDGPLTDGALRRHLESCAGCRKEHEAQTRIAGLVADAGSMPATVRQRFDALPFEQRVLAGLRERLAGESSPPVRDPLGLSQPRVPLQWAAAASLMILVAVAAVVLGQRPSVPPGGRGADIVAESRLPVESGYVDQVLPPREIPFVLREDLVGARTGRMPATTFVLEPAPPQETVMRASF